MTHYLRCDQCRIILEADHADAAAFFDEHRDHVGAWIVRAGDVEHPAGTE